MIVALVVLEGRNIHVSELIIDALIPFVPIRIPVWIGTCCSLLSPFSSTRHFQNLQPASMTLPAAVFTLIRPRASPAWLSYISMSLIVSVWSQKMEACEQTLFAKQGQLFASGTGLTGGTTPGGTTRFALEDGGLSGFCPSIMDWDPIWENMKVSLKVEKFLRSTEF